MLVPLAPALTLLPACVHILLLADPGVVVGLRGKDAAKTPKMRPRRAPNGTEQVFSRTKADKYRDDAGHNFQKASQDRFVIDSFSNF